MGGVFVELAPEEVSLVARLLPILQLAAWAVTVGLIWTADYWIRGLFGTAESLVSWIPWLGKKADAGLHSVEQRVTSFLGGYAKTAEQNAGTSFHAVAGLVSWLASTIAYSAVWDANLVYSLVWTHGLKTLQPRLARSEKAAKAQAASVAKTRAQAQAATRDLAHPRSGPLAAAGRIAARSVAAELGAFEGLVLPRLRVIEHEVGIAIPGDIANLRARTRTTESLYERLWQKVRGLDKLLGVGVLTGAVTLALARLDLGWLRCVRVRRIGRAMCGPWASILDALLAGALASLEVVELCRIAQAAQRIARLTVPLLEPLLLVEGAVCLGGGASFPSAYVQPPISTTIVRLSVV